MDDKIRHQLKINNIGKMKSPIILMNPTDFDNFKKKGASKVQNLKIGKNPTYQGIPVKTHNAVEKGSIVVYDGAVRTTEL